MCPATTLANPCTAEALENGQFYHAFLLDSHSYVQCDESGVPHVRPCPPSLVWSAADVTCVRQPEETTSTTTAPVPGGDKWKQMMSGSAQQQNQGSMQQISAMNSWQPSGARNPWSPDMGSRMDNIQQWMVRLTIIVLCM